MLESPIVDVKSKLLMTLDAFSRLSVETDCLLAAEESARAANVAFAGAVGSGAPWLGMMAWSFYVPTS